MNSRFLSLTIAVLVSLLASVDAEAFFFRKKGDGVISIKNIHSNDSLTIRYREKGKYDSLALYEISRVLQCRMTHQMHDIDIHLIELVDAIQDHFDGKTVEIVSGYRSPRFNEHLWKQGREVSRDSPHMYGQAMDIRIKGISTKSIYKYADKLNRGGVGHYESNGFVHVDIGRKDRWASK